MNQAARTTVLVTGGNAGIGKEVARRSPCRNTLARCTWLAGRRQSHQSEEGSGDRDRTVGLRYSLLSAGAQSGPGSRAGRSLNSACLPLLDRQICCRCYSPLSASAVQGSCSTRIMPTSSPRHIQRGTLTVSSGLMVLRQPRSQAMPMSRMS